MFFAEPNRRRPGPWRSHIPIPSIATHHSRRAIKSGARIVLAALMAFAGVKHFTSAVTFERIVPPFLPDHRLLVQISGAFELLGAIGILIPFTRKWAAWGLVALYVAVFPANIFMALHPDSYLPSQPDLIHRVAARAILWLRLPLQWYLAQWALWVGRSDGGTTSIHAE